MEKAYTSLPEQYRLKIQSGFTVEDINLTGDGNKKLAEAIETTIKLRDEQLKLGKELRTVNSEFSNLSKTAKDSLDKFADEIVSLYKDVYKAQKEAKINLIEAEIEAENDRHENEMDHLDDELSKYEEIIATKLKTIDREADKEDYQKELAKKTKARDETKSQINVLALDDSLEAKAKLAELNKQLTEQETEIEEFKNKHTIELRKENLNDQLDAYKKEIDGKKKAENDKHNAEKKRLNESKKEIERYYDNLLSSERHFANLRQQIVSGSLKGIESDFANFATFIEENSEVIGKSISENLTDKIKEAQNAITNITGSSSSSNTHKDYLDDTWDGGADQYVKSQQKRYEEAVKTGNVDLANRLKADAQRVGYDLSLSNEHLAYLDSTWQGGAAQYVSGQRQRYQTAVKNNDSALIAKLIEDARKRDYAIYHEGGMVGGSLTNPQAEQWAKLLLNKEGVFTEQQILNIPKLFGNILNNFIPKQQPAMAGAGDIYMDIRIDNMNANSKKDLDLFFNKIANSLKREGKW